MKRRTAYRLATEFLDSLANLEELVGITKALPSIRFQDKPDEVDNQKVIAHITEHTELTRGVLTIGKDSCIVKTFVATPDLDDGSSKTDEEKDGFFAIEAYRNAGCYLAYEAAEKFNNCPERYRITPGLPFEELTPLQIFRITHKHGETPSQKKELEIAVQKALEDPAFKKRTESAASGFLMGLLGKILPPDLATPEMLKQLERLLPKKSLQKLVHRISTSVQLLERAHLDFGNPYSMFMDFVSGYAIMLAGDFDDERVRKGMIEDLETSIKNESSQFEKCSEVSYQLGFVACVLYGAKGFNKALRIQPRNLATYLNRIYNEAKRRIS